MSMYSDDCRTASDALAKAARVREARRSASALPTPPSPPPAPKAPQPVQQAAEDELPVFCRSVRAVGLAAAEYFRVTYVDLISDRRSMPLVRYRQIMVYVAKIATPFSLPQIGRRFGRDHTTILHSSRVVEKMLAQGDSFAIESIAGIMKKLGVPWEHGAPRRLPERHNGGTPWQPDEVEHLKRCVLSMRQSPEQIALDLGRTAGSVEAKARAMGLKWKDDPL